MSQVLDEATGLFIKSVGTLFSDFGFRRSTGRVLGLLLICEPIYQSAEEMQLTLSLSAGSVSTALTSLQKMQLVTRINFKGNRHRYYQLDPNCWQKILQARQKQTLKGIEVANQGLKVHKGDPRLLNMRQLYSQFLNFIEHVQLQK